jgi:hypothetical protein
VVDGHDCLCLQQLQPKLTPADGARRQHKIISSGDLSRREAPKWI